MGASCLWRELANLLLLVAHLVLLRPLLGLSHVVDNNPWYLGAVFSGSERLVQLLASADLFVVTADVLWVCRRHRDCV